MFSWLLPPSLFLFWRVSEKRPEHLVILSFWFWTVPDKRALAKQQGPPAQIKSESSYRQQRPLCDGNRTAEQPADCSALTRPTPAQRLLLRTAVGSRVRRDGRRHPSTNASFALQTELPGRFWACLRSGSGPVLPCWTTPGSASWPAPTWSRTPPPSPPTPPWSGTPHLQTGSQLSGDVDGRRFYEQSGPKLRGPKPIRGPPNLWKVNISQFDFSVDYLNSTV